MEVLTGNQHTLAGPNGWDAHQQHERQSRKQVHPPGGIVGEFNPHTKCRCRNSHDDHDEKGWAVGWIGEGVVEAACLTAGSKGQEAIEQTALPASGAAALEAVLEDGFLGSEVRCHVGSFGGALDVSDWLLYVWMTHPYI